ncbi:phosphonopyruvate decarboxylase [Bradyrhizobium sp.]|uniref:phosphonopyruvate decarboxylase n=1 Tax=Bradyrhizobium sp. TaxID=376 RepID=UPI003C6AD058
MSISTAKLTDHLISNGFDFFSGVPCSVFGDLPCRLAENAIYIASANEGSALATAAGAAIAGRKTAVMMQNSGFGNIINPLTSLIQINQIPVLLLLSVRGDPSDSPDEPQHRVMGAVTRSLLDAIGIASAELSNDADQLEALLRSADLELCRGRPFAILVRRGQLHDADTPDGDAQTRRSNANYPLSRAQAVDLIGSRLREHDVVVATTGYISREVFAQIDRPANFYMQGSMGHAAALALGLAATVDERCRVVVIDGDGAALMHLGVLSTIGHVAPPNLIHLVLDNEGYASTGDQPTTSAKTDLARAAAACGYRETFTCLDSSALGGALKHCFQASGPTFIACKINSEPSEPLPRVTTAYTPEENLDRVQRAINATRARPAALQVETAE